MWNCDCITKSHKQIHKQISIKKAAKAFIQNQFNDWFWNKVSVQSKKGIDPADIKITSKLSKLKPLLTSWFINLHKHLSDDHKIIVNNFNSAGISEAISKTSTILDKVENYFREV